MEVRLYSPHPFLRSFIINISTVEARLPEGIKNVVTPYPPTPFQSLIFYQHHTISMGRFGENDFTNQPQTVLIGPQYSRVNVRVNDQLRAIRVDFLPGALHRLMGIPMNELFDKGFDATFFFGPDLKEVNEKLLEIPDLATGVRLIENFLLKKASACREAIPMDAALLSMFSSNGTSSIKSIADISCLSLRQFERKCKEQIGMNPKLYSRILKFSKAYRLHEIHPQRNWTEIAYESGYFDQMHMIRDFKTFAGVNPSVIEQELLDTPMRMQKDLPC